MKEAYVVHIPDAVDRLSEEEKSSYDELFWELRRMYQNGEAWSDNGIQFRQVIEDFIRDIGVANETHLERC